MPTFAYSGRTRGGQSVNGERVADSADAAVAALRREQINVTRIAAAKERKGAAAKKAPKGKKVAAKNLAVFTRQFSVMIDAGGVVGVILWKVIPTFAALFSGLGAELPMPTRIVIALSNNLVQFFPFLFVGVGLAAYAFKQYYDTESGRRVVDGGMLKAPVL